MSQRAKIGLILVAIGVVGTLEAIALIMGVDGTMYGLAIASIVGLTRLPFGKLRRRNHNE